MRRPLEDKTALVTGGSRGIGAAIVRRLARDGADVAFSYASSQADADAVATDAQAQGVRAVALRADQAVTAEVEAMVRKAQEALGRLDIVVNSAGVFVTGTIDDPALDVAGLDRQLAINLQAVATVVRTAVPLMNDGGSLVSVGTAGAMHHTPFAGIADYVATKAAVAAYTRSWARDLGHRRIRANVVQPGPIHTGMAPIDGPVADMLESGHRVRPLRHAGRGRGGRRLPGGSGGRLHHRGYAGRRRRPVRLSTPLLGGETAMTAAEAEPDYDHALRSNLQRVFNERDADRRASALAELFVDEPVMFEPDGVVHGRDAISAVAGRLLDQFGPSFRFTPDGAAVGHHGLAVLRWHAGPDGGPVTVTGADAAEFVGHRIGRLWVLLDIPA